MSKKCDLLGIILASVTGVAALTAMLIRAFAPAIIIPKLDVLAVLLLSLVTLVLDYYISKERCRKYPLVVLYSFLIFGLFPWLACFSTPITALKTAALGAVIFTAATFVFDSITDRLSSGSATRLAPIASAFGIYLAAQCLMGFF